MDIKAALEIPDKLYTWHFEFKRNWITVQLKLTYNWAIPSKGTSLNSSDILPLLAVSYITTEMQGKVFSSKQLTYNNLVI